MPEKQENTGEKQENTGETIKSDEQQNKDITLTVSYMSKPHKFVVSTNDNIGQTISRFKSELSLDASDNIRFVAVGKFLDPEKNYQQENIDRDTAVRAFRSNPVTGKNKNVNTDQEQAHSTINQGTNQTTGQGPQNSPVNPFAFMGQASPVNQIYGNQNYNSPPNMMNNMGTGGTSGGTMPGAMDMMSNMSQSQVSLQLDMLINDPALLDGTVRMMMPNRSEQEIESFKKQFVENMKRMRENPALISMVTSQMREAAHDPNMLNMMQVGNNPSMAQAMNTQMGQMGNQSMGNVPFGNPQMNTPQMGNQPMGTSQINQHINSPQIPNPYQMDPYGGPQANSNRNTAMNPTAMNPTAMNQIVNPCSHGYYHPALFSFSNLTNTHNPHQTGAAQGIQTQSKPILTDQEIEEKYSSHLNQMYQMGYTNKKKNIKALKACGGNLELAINYILDNIGEE